MVMLQLKTEFPAKAGVFCHVENKSSVSKGTVLCCTGLSSEDKVSDMLFEDNVPPTNCPFDSKLPP